MQGLKLRQVAQKLGIGKTKIYELVRRGQLPTPVKFGRASVWMEDELGEAIAILMEVQRKKLALPKRSFLDCSLKQTTMRNITESVRDLKMAFKTALEAKTASTPMRTQNQDEIKTKLAALIDAAISIGAVEAKYTGQWDQEIANFLIGNGYIVTKAGAEVTISWDL